MIYTGSNGGGASQAVDIYLRLVADKANGATSKQVETQVKQIADAAHEKFKQNGQKLAAEVNDWGKKISTGMGRAWDQAASANERANQRMMSGLQRVAAEAEKAADRQAKATQRSALAAERASIRQEMLMQRGARGFGGLATNAAGLAKSGLLLSVSDEDSQKLMQAFVKYEAIFGLFEHGLSLFTGINRELLTMRRYAQAAAAEQRALGVATAVARGAEGIGGAGRAAGAAGYLAGVGGQLAGAGAIVGTVAGIAAAGVAVHDVFVKMLGIGETMTGTLSDWSQTVKRNAELEKQIEAGQEARKSKMDQLKERQEKTERFFAARGRLDEAAEGVAGDRRLVEAANAAQARAGLPQRQGHGAETFNEQQAQLARRRDEIQDADKQFEKLRKRNNAIVERANAEAAKNVALANSPRFAVNMPGGADIGKGEQANEEGMQFTGMLGALLGFNGRGINNANFKPKGGQPNLAAAPLDLSQQVGLQQQAHDALKKTVEFERERVKALTEATGAIQKQIGALQQQKLAAHEAVQAERDKINSTKAHLSLLNPGQQHMLAGFLKEFRTTGKLDRGKWMMIEQMAPELLRGKLARQMNEQRAGELDKDFAGELDQTDMKEDLNNAIEKEINLRDALSKALEEQTDITNALNDDSKWLDRNAPKVERSQKNLEQERARMNGDIDPTKGETPAAAIKNAGKDMVQAAQAVGKEAVAQLHAVRDELNRVAQRIRGAA